MTLVSEHDTLDVQATHIPPLATLRSGPVPTRPEGRPVRQDWFDPVPPPPTLAAERRFRQEQLAAAFRLFAKFGFDYGLAGHITARDPEWTDHFWVNPFGVHFSQMKVSDLLLVNHQGEIVQGKGPLNRAAFAIHAALHEDRPDIVAAAHTHSTYGKAWAAFGQPLQALTQDSCVFYQDHGVYEQFHGVVNETDEGHRIGQALGGHKAVILKNHGILTVGPSVQATAWWYIALENACQVQLLAQAAGQPSPIGHEMAALTHSQIGRPGGAEFAFKAWFDQLVQREPEVLA